LKLYVPREVGMPETTPEAGSSVKPGGRLPEVTLQVYGGMPPEQMNVCA
jgi:hypothetical protein